VSFAAFESAAAGEALSDGGRRPAEPADAGSAEVDGDPDADGGAATEETGAVTERPSAGARRAHKLAATWRGERMPSP
jgi:hypothetical protein